MTAFVLVHGAWHGSWAWDRVVPGLQTAGATVVAPTLTGLAGDGSVDEGKIGLQTHVEDVVRIVDALIDERVVLVGHSYAGLVVREAADRRPNRVSQIVLVDGWAGPDDSSLLSLAPDWFGDGIHAAVRDGGNPSLIPAPHPAVFGVGAPDDVHWLEERLRPQPLRTFTDATMLSGAVDEIPGVAIHCRPENLPFADLASELGYDLVGIDGPHDVMVSDPGVIIDGLLAVAIDNSSAQSPSVPDDTTFLPEDTQFEDNEALVEQAVRELNGSAADGSVAK
jgi:pimeloyl-ACP methyl ester carboxylesterase